MPVTAGNDVINFLTSGGMEKMPLSHPCSWRLFHYLICFWPGTFTGSCACVPCQLNFWIRVGILSTLALIGQQEAIYLHEIAKYEEGAGPVMGACLRPVPPPSPPHAREPLPAPCRESQAYSRSNLYSSLMHQWWALASKYDHRTNIAVQHIWRTVIWKQIKNSSNIAKMFSELFPCAPVKW